MEYGKSGTGNRVQSNEAISLRDIPEDEIDLGELFSVLWRGKYIVILVTAIFAVISVVYAIKQPNVYESEALLAPAEKENSGALGGLTGQFSGLASLAGVNLGGSNSNKTHLAIEILNSRQFSRAFIQKHKILPDLMAAVSWSKPDNKVIYNEELFDSKNNSWMQEAGSSHRLEPSMQKAYKAFISAISAEFNDETGMVTISAQHFSPHVAQQWVNWLVEDINHTMKEREVTEAKRSTKFLQLQLEQTQIADIREVLYKLIEEQTKTIMFAEVRDEYVFKTIDAAIVPEEKIKPKRALIALFGTLLGGMFGLLIVLLAYFTSKRKA